MYTVCAGTNKVLNNIDFSCHLIRFYFYLPINCRNTDRISAEDYGIKHAKVAKRVLTIYSMSVLQGESDLNSSYFGIN